MLQLLAAGMKNREIAAALCIAVSTVNRHVLNIYSKLGATNRTEATAYAFRHNLVD